MRRKRKYDIKWQDFGLLMNKHTRSWANYGNKWKLSLKNEEFGVDGFWRFIAII